MSWLQRPVLGGRVNFPVCLAPMVGLSHVALRLMVRRYLPAGALTIWPTEMLNSRRLPAEDLGQTFETFREKDEVGLVPQILGNEADPIKAAVDRLEDWGAEGVDINMGCPVRKALRHNYGVALMGDPDYAAQVVKVTVQATKLPVSVKLRAGLQNNDQYLVDFVKGLEQAGAAWLCLHPRKAEQVRRGAADWHQIAKVRDQVSCAVIGNGDIQTVDDVMAMHQQTGCDMVMVGRALTARPWLLWQVGERLGWDVPRAPQTPEEEGAEFGCALLFFLEKLEEYFPLEAGLKRLNFHLRNAHPWLEFGHALAASVSRAKTYQAARERIEMFFTTSQSMSARTELRY
ncbi:MAG: tRNA dihydrouridine synthase [Bdellovibrionales bacterium]